MDILVDYYELLHVQPSAPAPVIKASYRTMMQKLNHHPDRGGEVGFAQQLNDAIRVLCDPHTRAQYDALRKQAASAAMKTPESQAARSEAWGEPGGSPKPDKDDRSTDSRDSKPQPDSSDTAQNAGGYTTFPPKPQCPFCLSVYPPEYRSATPTTGYTHSHRCRSCNGARTPIAHLPRTSNEELRKMHRQHHETGAQLFLQWPCDSPSNSVLSDFSPAGCALIYSNTINPDQVVMIETELFNAICTVRHCKAMDNKGYFIGLEFVTLDMLAGPGTLLSATA